MAIFEAIQAFQTTLPILAAQAPTAQAVAAQAAQAIQAVPSASIAFMGLSAAISAGAPVALFLALRKRFGLKAAPLLTGAGAFILFALILENFLHELVLRPAADGSIALRAERPALYVLYAALAAGVFEETARFLSFKLLKKSYGGLGAGLAYGIGHGGIESVLLVCLPMSSNIIASAMANAGDYGALGDMPQLPELFAALSSIEPLQFLLGGLERLPAIAIQISLSMLVWLAASNPGKWLLYPAAIA
ncbi:MAG: YhfC family intramembrane metalloprotease, partial [Clostridiales bacterium]|nr:YhfC family intramembrane metalloprotease [Clostridiales bacterium]